MFTFLKRLVGADERSQEVERRYNKQLEQLDETNAQLEQLQEQLDKVSAKTRECGATTLESLRPNEQRSGVTLAEAKTAGT